MSSIRGPEVSTRESPQREPFGQLPDGTPVERWTLAAGGVRLAVLSYGGIVQNLEVPNRWGHPANVALGFDSLDAYLCADAYFGALIGRHANRIAHGVFSLNGSAYRLPLSGGWHSLHGGDAGFDKRLWDVEPAEHDDGIALRLRRTSPDGEMGYPGTLETKVTYLLTDQGEFRIDFQATTDAVTVVNLTSHLYFNLAGEGSGSVHDHTLQIVASRYVPVDDRLVPTGELASVTGSPLDFRDGKRVGEDIRQAHPQLLRAHGYDHNFVLDKGTSPAPELAAVLYDPGSGRTLRLETTEPGLQFYSGNALDGSFAGRSGGVYRQGDGVCLETQHFPDSPNQPSFPTVVVCPGEIYRSTTVHSFGID